MPRPRVTVRFKENADPKFVEALCGIADMFGSTYYNKDTRTLVVLPKDQRDEQTWKAQLASLVSENAPLDWDAAAT